MDLFRTVAVALRVQQTAGLSIGQGARGSQIRHASVLTPALIAIAITENVAAYSF